MTGNTTKSTGSLIKNYSLEDREQILNEASQHSPIRNWNRGNGCDEIRYGHTLGKTENNGSVKSISLYPFVTYLYFVYTVTFKKVCFLKKKKITIF